MTGRGAPRVAVVFRTSYHTLDQLVVGYTTDLSRGGAFIRTRSFPPINAVVRLVIELPEDGGELAVVSRVVHVRDEAESAASGKPAGIGLEFLDLGPERLAWLERFISDRMLVADAPASPRTTAALKILIADDEPEWRDIASRVFIKRGDFAITANDGLEALAACLKHTPDLVVLDIDMPRMDGWQLLRVIRSRPTLASIPVIFVTAYAGDDERLRGYQLGVDDYLTKPFRLEELEARVDRLVQVAHQSRGAHIARKTLRGDLSQIRLASVLSFLDNERRSGILLVVVDVTACIFIRDGRPLRVHIDGDTSRSSKEKLMAILDWDRGQFEFAAQEVDCADELGSTMMALLLEHAKA